MATAKPVNTAADGIPLATLQGLLACSRPRRRRIVDRSHRTESLNLRQVGLLLPL
jgi:hypothetical protein